MLLAASHIVAVEDEVTVSAIKVTICGGIHRRLVAFLHTPDLKRVFKKAPDWLCHPLEVQLLAISPQSARSYLDFALAIIHHAVVGRHGLVGVQGGGVEGDSRNFGDAADGVGLSHSCRLVFVFPVTEELLKQSHLASGRDHLDLWERRHTVKRVLAECFEERCFSYLSILGVALILDELQACRQRGFALRRVGFGTCGVRQKEKLQLPLTRNPLTPRSRRNPRRVQPTGTFQRLKQQTSAAMAAASDAAFEQRSSKMPPGPLTPFQTKMLPFPPSTM